MMKLKPSEIYYSQDSIGNRFRNEQYIGDVLDAITEGSIDISDIPNIRVAHVENYGDKWFSQDNRRLWLFRELEIRGVCKDITVVQQIGEIPSKKMTTKNGGVSIRIRGNPWGEQLAFLEAKSDHWSSVDEASYASVDEDEQSEDYSDVYM